MINKGGKEEGLKELVNPQDPQTSSMDLKEKKTLIELIIQDEQLMKEYKELHKPFRTRGKYTIFFDTVMIFILFNYAKNAKYYGDILYPNRRKGFGNMLFISLLHCFTFMGVLFTGNILILGINPVHWIKKYKEVDKKIWSQDPYKDLSFEEVLQKMKELQAKEDLIRKEKDKTILH
jgi:hypothetical protein